MSKHLESQQGSSLIEVLIAVLVLSIGMVGALKLQSEAVRQNADSRYTLLAGAYAQTALDGLSFNYSGKNWQTGSLESWKTDIKRDLPQGTGSVACAANVCTVTITWTPPGKSTPEKAEYAVRTS
ncbi:type IV pilus modification PilV family protein [Uliginosibacterium gangwonense]|uniref:type IV pilus modification PilV family protein n=1 Tax=Uliginosibacterium gangwonense TaxID=392736 RepID=UPI0003816F3E|nr:prepilin-type N-terminal cleavage/methylation domain-containing protein [Uliginosibacterium gangwonense]